MTSAIDATKPVFGNPTTQSVRDNFSTAAAEITALQNGLGSAGTITGVNAGTGLTGGGTSGNVTVTLGVPVLVSNGGTGAITAPAALANLGAAPLFSPGLTGTPTAPTAPPSTQTTQLATTAFVASAVTAGTIPVPIAIANGGTGAVTAPAALVALGAAPIASPAFTGNPTAPTQAVGDADTSLATTAFVQAAARYLNYADDSGFSVNQRGYVSGTALAAGIYGHDRWKAGAGGCTYTFSASSGPSTTITITAGTLQQIIEGASLVGGNYMLSWIGTAQGRVGGGSYAASPVAVSGIVAGANTTVEFNAGTLSQVKFEVGTVATAWAANSARYDLANCQRFYQTGTFGLQGFAASTAMTVAYTQPLQVAMRALPTCVVVSESSTTNMAARGIVADSAMQIRPYGAAANVFSWLGTFTASADL